jgi:hypothetical protein
MPIFLPMIAFSIGIFPPNKGYWLGEMTPPLDWGALSLLGQLDPSASSYAADSGTTGLGAVITLRLFSAAWTLTA